MEASFTKHQAGRKYFYITTIKVSELSSKIQRSKVQNTLLVGKVTTSSEGEGEGGEQHKIARGRGQQLPGRVQVRASESAGLRVGPKVELDPRTTGGLR